MKKEEDLEKKVKELEKSNRWMKGVLLVFTGIFFMALCIGFGFVIGKEMSNKEEVKEDDIQLEKLTLDSKVVKDLFEIFREDKDCESCVYWDEYSTSQAKKYIAYQALDETDFDEVKCGDLSDSYMNGLYCSINDDALKYYGENDKVGFESAIKNEKTISVSAEVLEKKYKELFGKDAKMENEDFSIGHGPILHYDEAKNLYAEFRCECGGECAGVTQTLDTISQDGKKLVLNTTILENADRITKYYVSYTFEFEEETGNYIFVNREEKIDSTSALIARSNELKNNFASLLDGFAHETKEYRFSETGNVTLYKVIDQDGIKELINDTFVNTSVASKFVPFYEKNGLFYSLNGSGSFSGEGYYIFEYEVVSEVNDTAVVEVEYIECYDDEVHDKIDSCQNNPWNEVFTIKFELKKINDKWLIENMESDMVAPVIR